MSSSSSDAQAALRRRHRPSGRRAARRAALTEALRVVVEGQLTDGRDYAELSIEELITPVPVARSTFYAYFEDKSELLVAFGDDAFARLQEAADAWWQHPVPTDPSQLTASLAEITRVYERDALIWRALIGAAAYDPRVRAWYAERLTIAADDLGEHVAAGQRAGVVPVRLHARQTAVWLTWMIERGFSEVLPNAGEDEIPRLLDSLTDVIWRTLYD